MMQGCPSQWVSEKWLPSGDAAGETPERTKMMAGQKNLQYLNISNVKTADIKKGRQYESFMSFKWLPSKNNWRFATGEFWTCVLGLNYSLMDGCDCLNGKMKHYTEMPSVLINRMLVIFVPLQPTQWDRNSSRLHDCIIKYLTFLRICCRKHQF